MILGISIPDGAKVEVTNNIVHIIFDEKETKRDLWNARFDLWVTNGGSVKEFRDNAPLDSKGVVLNRRNKLEF